jgi:hypothetical protein
MIRTPVSPIFPVSPVPSSEPALSPKQVATLELTWFFGLAEGQMGKTSNFIAALVPARHRHAEADLLDRRVRAATAYRTIRRWLIAVEQGDDHHAGVLKVAHEVRAFPLILRSTFGPLAGIIVRLAAAGVGLPDDDRSLELLEARVAEGIAHTLGRHGPGALAALRKEAHRRYTRAFDAYTKVRGAAPLAIRSEP